MFKLIKSRRNNRKHIEYLKLILYVMTQQIRVESPVPPEDVYHRVVVRSVQDSWLSHRVQSAIVNMSSSDSGPMWWSGTKISRVQVGQLESSVTFKVFHFQLSLVLNLMIFCSTSERLRRTVSQEFWTMYCMDLTRNMKFRYLLFIINLSTPLPPKKEGTSYETNIMN